MIERDPRVIDDNQREAVIRVALQLLVKGGIHATVTCPEGSTMIVTIRRPWAKKARKRKDKRERSVERFYDA